MLQAIVSYMPVVESTPGIGSISYSHAERVKLAKESCKFVCPQCGMIEKIAQEMVKVQPSTRVVELPGKKIIYIWIGKPILIVEEKKEAVPGPQPKLEEEEKKILISPPEEKKIVISTPEEKKEIPLSEKTITKADQKEEIKEPEITKKEEVKKEEHKKEGAKKRKDELSPQTKLKIKKVLQGELGKRLRVLNIAFLVVLAVYVGNVFLTYYLK